MNRSEHNQVLDEIEDIIDKSETVPDKIFESLEEMYNFKPVGSKFHQVKCKALMKNNLMQGRIEQYMQLYSKESVNPENIKLWNQVLLAMEKEAVADGAVKDEIMADEAGRERYLLNRLTGNNENKKTEDNLVKIREKFVNGSEDENTIRDLERAYYLANDRMMALIMYMYGSKLYEDYEVLERRMKYTDVSNMRFLYERIKDGGNFIIIADKEDESDYDILSYILNSFGCIVYMIAKPIVADGDYDIRDTVKISMENGEKYDDCTVIPAVSKDGKSDNIPYIIDYICKEYTDNDFAMVIGQNRTMEIIGSEKYICKRFQRLSQFEVTYMEDRTGFGRAGDTLSYLEYLYSCNVRELVYRQPQCKFSIVVPARNSSATLEYTLKTCLNQDYKGDFEIVLSDNSSEGNTQVYELYQKIDDDRLVYYRTPRQLALSKSFEYAYLQTKGEFVISIGSDDGIFPWALSALEFVLNSRKDADVVVWDRGFYAWPGFNGGQENQLEINRHYEKGQISIIDDDGQKNAEVLKENPSAMYALPNLYINSGFRRRWLSKVYEQTGEILGGNCQDIYTGLVNINIDIKTIRIDYPITIAGMSDNSIGRLITMYAEGKEDGEIGKVKKQCDADTGLYDMQKTVYGKILPNFNTDVTGMYECAGRLKSKNLLKYELFGDFSSIKKMLEKMTESLAISGDKCYMYIMDGAAVVKHFGPDVEKWYLDNVVPLLDEMRLIPENKDNKNNKTYTEGFNAIGGVTLDAGRYGVKNVSEAVDLFKEFIHF